MADRYGTCATGQENRACAYVYGYSIAELDTKRISAPAGYFWWIDVEEGGISWLPDTAVNNADIEGMVAGFAAAGAATGLYSTTTQWADIAGTTSTTSPLAGLPNWVAGRDRPGIRYSELRRPRLHAEQHDRRRPVPSLHPGDQDYDVSCASPREHADPDPVRHARPSTRPSPRTPACGGRPP